MYIKTTVNIHPSNYAMSGVRVASDNNYNLNSCLIPFWVTYVEYVVFISGIVSLSLCPATSFLIMQLNQKYNIKSDPTVSCSYELTFKNLLESVIFLYTRYK